MADLFSKTIGDSINVRMFQVMDIAREANLPVMFLSNPGLGKTTTVNLYAQMRGYKVVMLRGNTVSTPEDLIGFTSTPSLTVSPTRESIQAFLDNYEKLRVLNPLAVRSEWLTEVKECQARGEKVLLFLDELTTANDFIQAALLHIIFEREVKREKLPEDTLVVAAGNYFKNLSTTMNMLPPTLNRFILFNIIPVPSDLKHFLGRYAGYSTGTFEKDGYMATLKKHLAKISTLKKDVSEIDKFRWLERTEQSVQFVATKLWERDKVMNLAVTELSDLYAENVEKCDPKLYGFPSLRSIGYIVDAAVAAYILYGKSIIDSEIMEGIIEGLAGIGLTYNNNGEVKITKIASKFHEDLKKLFSDIEAQNNKALPKYSNFFQEVMVNYPKSIDVSVISAVRQKLDELNADLSLKQVERPVEPTVINGILNRLLDTAKTEMDQKFKKVVITPEVCLNWVTTWNEIATTITSLYKIISDPSRVYAPEVIADADSIMTKIIPISNKLRQIRLSLSSEAVDASSLAIPEIKGIRTRIDAQN